MRSSLDPYLTRSSPRLFHDVHHRGFWPKQLMAVWSLLLQGGSEGSSFISQSTTPHRRLHDTMPFAAVSQCGALGSPASRFGCLKRLAAPLATSSAHRSLRRAAVSFSGSRRCVCSAVSEKRLAIVLRQSAGSSRRHRTPSGASTKSTVPRARRGSGHELCSSHSWTCPQHRQGGRRFPAIRTPDETAGARSGAGPTGSTHDHSLVESAPYFAALVASSCSTIAIA